MNAKRSAKEEHSFGYLGPTPNQLKLCFTTSMGLINTEQDKNI